MDLDDLFKRNMMKKRNHRSHEDRHYRNDHHDHHRDHGDDTGYHHGHHKIEMIRSIIQAMPHKKALLAAVLIIGVFMLVLGVALLWAVLPLVTDAARYVEANGIKGVVNTILPYAEKFWKGNG